MTAKTIAKSILGSADTTNTSRIKIILAFAAVYLIWGSTYLAIKYAMDTIPPFMMAACRFLLAGGVLYAGLIISGVKRPQLKHWYSAAIVGFLLLTLGNGGVVIAERNLSTGMVSLLVAIAPVFIVILEHLHQGRRMPNKETLSGIALGTLGIVFLVGPSNLMGASGSNWIGIAAAMVSSLAWSIGTIYSRSAAKPSSMLMATSMQMICGGVAMAVGSIVMGEHTQFDVSRVSYASVAAILYLVTFGSLLAFSAYVYLLQHVSAARVSTHSYVNPIVAVFLGWALLGEAITPQTMMSACVIMAAVWFIAKGTAKIKSAS
ncbi:MAG: EamA family transporter [Candidatus Obscuribacterales bacterium]|jgi:drug/metabolite transporter (DMT)-like permease|nr:EamA family transporter [Candidatus Obscuribacterales bacterium]